jgi:hypothetical protein
MNNEKGAANLSRQTICIQNKVITKRKIRGTKEHYPIKVRIVKTSKNRI